MMNMNMLLILSLAIPLAASVACLLLRDRPNARDGLTFVAAIATFAAVLAFWGPTIRGLTAHWSWSPSIEICRLRSISSRWGWCSR